MGGPSPLDPLAHWPHPMTQRPEVLGTEGMWGIGCGGRHPYGLPPVSIVTPSGASLATVPPSGPIALSLRPRPMSPSGIMGLGCSERGMGHTYSPTTIATHPMPHWHLCQAPIGHRYETTHVGE